ncbi:hypothetical protein DH2020_044741 [Rehmannia glutinosa]|uniref:Reverse transcriptase domain-containing protein n=1 Tax=Rehmannia glutinosa TaxID=99300 RepID=A0ABR0UHN0_REHGL
MAPLMENIVDPAHEAFVGRRLMTENIHLAQELLRQYNRKYFSPRCLVKIDLRKAYDFVTWSFLRAVLEGMGFPSKFIRGIVGQKLVEIHRLVNMPIGSMPFKYLGIPLAAGKLKVVHYASLVEKVASYINAWANCTLSYVGRTELIRSVVQGMECFWLSILPIPGAIIDKITNLCRLFLWGERKALVAWKNICLPKSEGGLGFRDIKSWNIALLAKVLWNIHEKRDSLWIRWVDQVYIKGTSVWDWSLQNGTLPYSNGFLKSEILLSLRKGRPKRPSPTLLSGFPRRNQVPERHMIISERGAIHKFGQLMFGDIIFLQSIPLYFSLESEKGYKLKTVFITCAFCGNSMETSDHLFFQCNTTK